MDWLSRKGSLRFTRIPRQVEGCTLQVLSRLAREWKSNCSVPSVFCCCLYMPHAKAKESTHKVEGRLCVAAF